MEPVLAEARVNPVRRGRPRLSSLERVARRKVVQREWKDRNAAYVKAQDRAIAARPANKEHRHEVYLSKLRARLGADFQPRPRGRPRLALQEEAATRKRDYMRRRRVEKDQGAFKPQPAEN
jgi:hypothetical protein